MMKAELLSDLCCPETHQPLRQASEGALASLNERIRSGQVRNRAGTLLDQPCVGGLLREDGEVLYLVREGLPILLIAEGILVGAPSTS
jgi:uncharacterized protein YbaR (Trm112 family)